MRSGDGGSELTGTLLALLAEAPGFADDLAHAIGCPPTDVHGRLEHLAESGKVVRVGGPGTCWYRIATHATAAEDHE